MTQTVKDNSNNTQKKTRPGQRQQERLMRIARRRRRRQILMGTSVTLVLIALVGLGFWQYYQITTQQQVAAQKVKDQQATATTKVKDQQATATEKVAAPTQTATANLAATAAVQSTATAANQAWLTVMGTSLPKAGPTSPPTVSGKTVTITDGIKYIDIKEGTGTAIQSGSTASVEYTGWITATGKKFDSSFDHGGIPFDVAVGQGKVIPGWDKGLIGMKVGGTRRLEIPAAQGYGASGSPPVIPANADLVFDVTLLAVQ